MDAATARLMAQDLSEVAARYGVHIKALSCWELVTPKRDGSVTCETYVSIDFWNGNNVYMERLLES